MNPSFRTLPSSLQEAASHFFIDNTPFVANTTLPTHLERPTAPANRVGVRLSTSKARLSELRAQQCALEVWVALTEGTPLYDDYLHRLKDTEELLTLWERKMKFASP